MAFTLPDTQREALLTGLDEVDQTLRLVADIRQFQERDRQARPWVYGHGIPLID
ncbi:hypothetical protein RGU70_12390 [Herbaspirillum sp. RTI4]|uniref:hypothetical protein n=1 Tax=Herbaspirillum sp. RTI4 TaxID=3048640 RepID=UPI002AB46E95|nr:hypothetical protein [Herbaspirillum sp. RTI4]MDY7579119.1 hypothetical protein [Herbaspirillum sp. RTI4]MEA9981302.1 hypothetical protein [Herbaspirillum sp. RTI4]